MLSLMTFSLHNLRSSQIVRNSFDLMSNPNGFLSSLQFHCSEVVVNMYNSIGPYGRIITLTTPAYGA